jgi:hypothetical protein
VATEQSRPGFYLDRHGVWQKERRVTSDRRKGNNMYNHERRKMFRRKADRELYSKDHKQMIADALDDFAAEHSGHSVGEDVQ